MKTLVIILGFGILWTSCYKDNEEELYPSVTSCDTVGVSYASQVANIIQTSCLACHANSVAGVSGGGIALEGHSNLSAYITSNQARFIGAVEHNSSYSAMPKGANKWSDCNISILKNWIKDGTPNN